MGAADWCLSRIERLPVHRGVDSIHWNLMLFDAAASLLQFPLSSDRQNFDCCKLVLEDVLLDPSKLVVLIVLT